MRELSFILVVLICVGFQPDETNSKVLFEMFNTKFNGQQNLSYGFTETRGLKPDEKQAILDMTNALRLQITTGQNKESAAGISPNASNMFVMEWDDALAEFAQNWADTCSEDHSLRNVSQSNYTNAKIAENLSGGTVLIEINMFGEVRHWNYLTQKCLKDHECGHYNTLVSWSMFRLGCGYSVCQVGITKNVQLFCEFAPYRAAGVYVPPGKKRYKFQHEYFTNLKPGVKTAPAAYAPTEPCSECLQGWDYCMEGGLCATKEQCESDPSNKCVCLNDKAKCEANGGKFDTANCRCKCPADKMGINCAQKCQNAEGNIVCGVTCGWSMDELFNCLKACGSCGTDVSSAYTYWQVERKTRNKHHLKVRALAPHPTPPIPKDVKTATLPDRGNCTNRNSDYFCENIRRRNYCNSSINGATWKYYCAESCDSCNNKEYLTLVANAVKRYKEKHPQKTNSSGTDGVWTPVGSNVTAGISSWVPSSASSSSSGSEGEWTNVPSSSSGSGSEGWTPSSGSGGGSGEWSDYPSSAGSGSGSWKLASGPDYASSGSYDYSSGGSGSGSEGWNPVAASDYPV